MTKMRAWRWWRWALVIAVCLLLLTSHEVDAAKKKKTKKKTSATSSSEPTSDAGHSDRDDDPVIIEVRGLRNTAKQLTDKKQFDGAIKNYRDALTLMHDRVWGAGKEAVTDKKHRSMDAAMYAQLLNDYGTVLTRVKEYDEAVEVLADAVEMIKRVFGESHPSYGLAIRSLADAYMGRKDYRQAIEQYRTLRVHVARGLGERHEAYVETHLRIGEAYKALGKPKQAIKTYKRALEAQGEEIDVTTRGIAELFMELSTAEAQVGKLDDALASAIHARALFEAREGQNSLEYAFSLNAMAGVHMKKQQVREALDLLQEAHKIAVALYGERHQIVRDSQRNIDQVQLRLTDLEQAKAEGAMKPSTASDAKQAGQPRASGHAESANNTHSPLTAVKWAVGLRVEREIDGLWFPATIVRVADDGDDCLFEIEYDEEHTREADVSKDELRPLDEHDENARCPPKTSRPSLTPQQQRELKDSLLFQATDYDPNKAPTVVVHHKGESASASAYIINGLENNIAAGNGLRGIRWLRVNTV
ncbi:TPA: hypothetical protein N0F65_000269 [Lagenidium giganteum]|uniref:Kinesin light chain n=1 Tax=Lagenidium giganteum TaxID=4803 RepID=A0AAV2Z9C3_9STRA|nr:TPA: hypothetical protein N0F65_000269 [Lagenidium giganteum]